VRRTGIITAAVALLLAVAPALAASVRPSTALLGGGRIGHAFKPYPQFVRVRASRNRHSVSFQADALQTCAGYSANPALAAGAPYVVPLHRNGSFSGTKPFHSANADGTLSFRGRYVSATLARGTAREQLTFSLSDGRHFSCDTGAFQWTARAPRTQRGGGAPLAGGAYYGTTSQAFPFTARISHNRRSIRVLAFEWRAHCTFSATTLSSDSELELVPIGRRSHATLVAHPDAQTTDTIRYTTSLGATAREASGQLRVDVTRTVNGRQVGTCASGAIRVLALP
jgi:hypothetical protein